MNFISFIPCCLQLILFRSYKYLIIEFNIKDLEVYTFNLICYHKQDESNINLGKVSFKTPVFASLRTIGNKHKIVHWIERCFAKNFFKVIYLSFHIDKRRLSIYSLLIYLTYLHNQFSKFILYRRTIDVITYDKSGIGILYLAQINITFYKASR